MQMGKILFFNLCVAIMFFLMLSAVHIHFFPSLDFGQANRSSLKNSDNYKLSMSTIYSDGYMFKKCFYISTLMNFSLNCDFIHDKIISNKTCGENTHTIRFIKENEMRNSNHDQNSCKSFITLASYKGRLGNQMFEVASLLGIAFTYDLVPVIPHHTILRKYFDFPDTFAIESSKLLNPVRLTCGTPLKVCNFSKWIDTSKRNISLLGYLQSWKYFYNIRRIMKRVFKLKEKHLVQAKRYLSSVSINNHYRVCMHVRRGDLISKQRLSKGYAIPDNTFFEKARTFYLKKLGLVQFVVISEDKEWCRKNILNVSISQFTDPGDDLALLSLCDHVVVTLGTFGWWGAWLSGGTTVYFDRFPTNGSWLESKMEKGDYYPPGWIGIS